MQTKSISCPMKTSLAGPAIMDLEQLIGPKAGSFIGRGRSSRCKPKQLFLGRSSQVGVQLNGTIYLLQFAFEALSWGVLLQFVFEALSFLFARSFPLAAKAWRLVALHCGTHCSVVVSPGLGRRPWLSCCPLRRTLLLLVGRSSHVVGRISHISTGIEIATRFVAD